MNKTLIIIGITILLIGILWPWISKLGLGKLPGDILIERENTKIYLPITSSIVISIIVSLLFWIFRK
jgi:hypothetical protein